MQRIRTLSLKGTRTVDRLTLLIPILFVNTYVSENFISKKRTWQKYKLNTDYQAFFAKSEIHYGDSNLMKSRLLKISM